MLTTYKNIRKSSAQKTDYEVSIYIPQPLNTDLYTL